MVPPVGNLFATLDIAKIATTVLFVASATNKSDNSPRFEVFDDWGKEIIMPCVAQGLTTPLIALTNVENLHIKVLCFLILIIIFCTKIISILQTITETSRF